MLEKVNQPVDVLASFRQGPQNTVKVTPHRIRWNHKDYRVDTFGLYHPERRGTRLFHIFSFSSGSTAFRVELDPDTLEWVLVEVFYEQS